MRVYSWLFLVLILFNPNNSYLFAQDINTVIRGKVLQLNSNAAIPRASVFINGTTYGTICTDSGSFTLPYYSQAPFTLTVTAIGFETEQMEVTENMIKQEQVVYLTPKTELLQSIEIKSPAKEGWAEYGAIFQEQLIGYSDFAKQCKLLNKEVLEFYYDKNENTLQVIARAPLKIRNEAIGYQVTYWLEEFLYNFKTTRLTYKGYSKFDTLNTKSKMKQSKWNVNRAAAYHGSINHFMRSVYNGKTTEQGFEIRVLKRIKADERGNYLPVRTDTLNFNDEKAWDNIIIDILDKFANATGQIQDLAGQLKKWEQDTVPVLKITQEYDATASLRREYRFLKMDSGDACIVQYYEQSSQGQSPEESITDITPRANQRKINLSFNSATNQAVPGYKGLNISGDSVIVNRLKEQLVQKEKERHVTILYNTPVPVDSIRTVNQAGEVMLLFDDFLLVTYTKEQAEEPYKKRYAGVTGEKDDQLQESIISLANQRTIFILPDGNFYDAHNLQIENYWSYEKLDKLMPLNYSE